MHTLPSALVACFVAYGILQVLHCLFISPHRKIPGPFAARLSKVWFLHKVNQGRFEHLNIALHRHYSAPIVRVAPNWYSISDPAALKTIYGPGSKFCKSEWYDAWRPPHDGSHTLFSDRVEARHARDRRKITAMYSMSTMVSYESHVDECTGIFTQRLAEIADSGAAVDMLHWFQCYAFDVIGLITYNRRFGFLDCGDDIGNLLVMVQSNLVFNTLSSVFVKLHPLTYPLGEKFGTGGRAKNFLLKFTADMWRKCEEEGSLKPGEDLEEAQGAEKAETPAKPIDMLAKYVGELNKGTPGWTRRDVIANTLINVVAGSDTTAITLSAILYYLLKFPQTLKRLRSEIEEFENKGDCGKLRVSFKESMKMPYLQAVIKEALRLHPAVGLPLWRDVPQGGAEICGHSFKGGEVVGTNAWVLQYDTEVYGPDAADFRPERWLDEEDQDRLKAMERSWIPFGLGSRFCIGKNISMLEMCKMVPHILREFDFHLESPNATWDTVNYWFVKHLNFKIKITKRR